MDFPRWIRSEILVSAESKLEAEEIARRLVQALTKRGATDIQVIAGRVQFRAERARFDNFNPLTYCRAGWFQVERQPNAHLIRYEFDLLYLLLWTVFIVIFAILISFISVAQGSWGFFLIFGIFFAGIIPLNYAFYSWRAKALFRTAIEIGIEN